MIRPQKGGTKRLHLAKLKTTRNKSTGSPNRRTVTHRPLFSSSIKSRENRQSKVFNKDWFVQTIPTHHHDNTSPRFLCNKERLRLGTLIKEVSSLPKKQIISRKGRDRIQMIQDTNSRVNGLKQIDRVLLSTKMRLKQELPTTNPTPSSSSTSNKGISKKSGSMNPPSNQRTLKQLKQIVQKHMEQVKGGPNIPKQSSATGQSKKQTVLVSPPKK